MTKVNEETLGTIIEALAGSNKEPILDKNLIETFDKILTTDPEDAHFEHFLGNDYFERYLIEKYPNNNMDIAVIYQSYIAIDGIVEHLIESMEGSACCADKSRWIVRSCTKYLKTAEMFDMTIDDKCYWKPHFGTMWQWVKLVKGATYLIKWGKYDLFIKELGDLLNEANTNK